MPSALSSYVPSFLQNWTNPPARDVEAGATETTPLLQEDRHSAAAPAAGTPQKPRFIPGSYPANKLAGEKIMAEANKRGHIGRAVIPELKMAGVDLTVSTMTTTALYFVSTYLLLQQNTALLGQLRTMIKHPQMQQALTKAMESAEFRQSVLKAIEYFNPAENPATQLVMVQALTTAVNQLASPLKALISAVVFPPKGEGKEALVMREAVKLIRQDTKEIIPQLPEKTRTAFETRLENFENSLDNSGPYNAFRYDSNWMKKEFDKLIFTLSLPATVKDVYQHGIHGNPEIAAEKDRLQEELANSFDEPVKSQLTDFMSIGRHFFLHPETTRAPVVFLQGPPATGKTYATREIAKKVFDAELIEISMKELAEYLGENEDFRFYRPPSEDKSFLTTVGKAWRQIIERTPNRNVVWFIDEVDFEKNEKHQRMIEAIKKWLNPDNVDHPRLEDLNIAPNIRGPVVFASNYGYDKKRFHAFTDRLQHHIVYPHWSPDKLAARAQEHFNSQIDGLKDIHNQESIDQTRTQVAELVPFILSEAAKYSSDKVTLRDIQRLIEDAVVNHVVAADTKRPIEQEAFKERISKKLKETAEAEEERGGDTQMYLGGGMPMSSASAGFADNQRVQQQSEEHPAGQGHVLGTGDGGEPAAPLTPEEMKKKRLEKFASRPAQVEEPEVVTDD
jgi:hypothetical protein